MRLSVDKCALILKGLSMLMKVKDLNNEELDNIRDLIEDVENFTESWQLDRGGEDHAPTSLERV